jgi:NAD(P)-dependent dehydrogenase (short-subunit alcohol dehydrogenase family)
MATTGLAPFSLQGRCALVTGASRGIGAAIAVALASAGADVALCARSAAGLETVAAAVGAAGRRALSLPCDVCRRDEAATAVERAWGELGAIDILVTSAGGPLFQAPILAVREDGWNRVLDLNLTSVLRVCQLVGARMVERRVGSIITIASALPTRAWPAVAAYSAAKAAVLNLTQALAVEWGAAGVRVNAICPGWISTDLNRAYVGNPATAALAIEAVPLRRWGETDDLVGTAIWLASDAARYVTGALIPVDGGLAVGLPERWRQAMDLSP